MLTAITVVIERFNMGKAINKACLQKPRIQTAMFIPTAYRPHTRVSAAKKDQSNPDSHKEPEWKLRAFVQEEEAEIAARYAPKEI